MVQVVNSFQDKAVRALFNRNPEKLGELLAKHWEHKNQGGTIGAESFIRSSLIDEGAIDLTTGELVASYCDSSKPSNNVPKATKFNNWKAQNLRETNPERCMELCLEYEEAKKHNSPLAKLSLESFIELHADLNPGEIPWPSDIQAALAKARK